MRISDVLRFDLRALDGARGRAALLMLAMAIGVASVVVMTALGEGARRYVSNEFSGLGTHLLVVMPGRAETTGDAPPLIGGTARDLTLDDALALTRSSAVRRVAPLVVGSAPVSRGSLERESTVLGSTAELLPVRNLELAKGRFIPAGDPRRGITETVIGSKLKQELFGADRALGEWIRIGGQRYRVVGVLRPMGESLGMDVGDLAVIPVANAQSLYNTRGMFRVLVQASGRNAIPRAEKAIIEILRKRHDGDDDVTVITQDALLATFDSIVRTLTYTVVGVAAISLAVAGILIMNVMLVSVAQRTSEIGLLKALGSPDRQILTLFLAEAAILALGGALAGTLIAYAGVWVLDNAYPDFPLSVPLWSLAAALAVSLITGVLFGILPARRAARLDPVQSLSGL